MKGIIIIIIIVAVIIILGGGFYVFSTINNVVELEEKSPLIKDTFDTMDDAKKAEFNRQTEEKSGESMIMKDDMPLSPELVAQGSFKPRAHEVKGKALLIDSDGKKTLRFEDFETINGPSLYIYLASDLGNDDFIDLGPIKATKGNVNYEIPEGTDTGKYNKVLVWCRPFRVLFSYAELN